MKQVFWIALIAFCSYSGNAWSQGRHTSQFNFDWQFKQGPINSDSEWKTVQLPHDAAIYGSFSKENSTSANGWLPLSCGMYRKSFALPVEAKSKMVLIQFDGVYRDAQVWINGKYLGQQLNGYIGFEYNLTPYVFFDKQNLIEVYYDNTTKETSRWYTGEGIYRDVWLNIVDRLSIPLYGTYITTPVITTSKATVSIETEVSNSYDTLKKATLLTEILDPEGKMIASAKATVPVMKNGKYVFHQEIVVPKPALWDLQAPNLYKAVSKVYISETLCDKYETSFGIREIAFSPDKGLLLNGRKVIAVGGDIHHDLGCIGSAALARGYERRLQLLKDMGCNSVRLSHNPHSPVLLSLCDKMGILVFDEAYDKWTSQYYGGVISFMDGAAKDIESFVKRDRNHPSVYIWSVGNEVNSQFGEFEAKFETQSDNPDYGVTRLKYLIGEVKKYDPSRKVTVALFPSRNSGWYVEWENYPRFETFMQSAPPPMAFNMDVVSCNYTQHFFERDHENYPQLTFIASETGTNLSDFKRRKIAWQEMDTSYVAGYYYWSAMDYLGESLWPTKTWARAFYDLSDELTPLGYLHQSYFSKKPMVRAMVFEQDTAVVNKWNRNYSGKSWSWYPMAAHWNWEKFKTVKIQTFTNCEEVELLVNGKSQGRQLLKTNQDSVITWLVPYEKGSLKAIGRNKGKVVDQHELVTAGKVVKLVLEPDRSAIKADGLDLSYIKIRFVDDKGITVPDADALVDFEVKGAGYNAGVCNGDTYSNELYQSNSRTTYQGKCLLVIRSEREKGDIRITAKTNGLPTATCVIKVE